MKKHDNMLKEEKHELLYREGYYLPPISSAVVTHEYLEGVKAGTYYCPKFPVKMMGCYRPPTKDKIADELKKAQEGLGLNFGY